MKLRTNIKFEVIEVVIVSCECGEGVCVGDWVNLIRCLLSC